MKILLMYKPSKKHLKKLKSINLQAQFSVAENMEQAEKFIQDAEIVFGNRFFYQVLPKAQKLRWMQSNSIGMDMILKYADCNKLKSIILTSSKSAYKDEIADHALALLLGITRNLTAFVKAKDKQVWQRLSLDCLKDRRVLFLGWGNIAQEIAGRLKGFKVHMYAIRKTAKYLVQKEVKIFGNKCLFRFLPNTDILINTLPLTDETAGFVNKDVFKKLKSGALFINVGRGGTVDEQALQKSLENKKIKAVGLDVLSEEPPAKNHWIWKFDNVLFTPHVARSIEKDCFQFEKIFEENFRRYCQKKKLLNVVDLKQGY